MQEISLDPRADTIAALTDALGRCLDPNISTIALEHHMLDTMAEFVVTRPM